ncbi:Uncharacterised protein [Bergeriella denitrificans]|uniref:Uncharacterized protein n=1 Tax=Bergeriella denitrificans TaxID=494 RepID=A0A378UJN6_BERDE|nr:Uncharacterised protein [Bergeriella denitrificans]
MKNHPFCLLEAKFSENHPKCPLSQNFNIFKKSRLKTVATASFRKPVAAFSDGFFSDGFFSDGLNTLFAACSAAHSHIVAVD